MPFTPTHILAVLPIAAIKRLRLPFSALVIGSMIPDFPLFVPLWPDYGTTHSIPGMFTACLPLGLACFLVFQLLMKQPLFALLPEAIQSRCLLQVEPRIKPSARFIASASIAIVIGSCTHIIWDSFTHRGRWGTQLFPWLGETALTIDGHSVPGYKVLQYGSTLIGLPCLLLLLARWLDRQVPGPLGSYRVLSRSAKLTTYFISVAVPMAAAFLIWRQRGLSRYDRLGQSITASGFAFMVEVLMFCLAFRVAEGRFFRLK